MEGTGRGGYHIFVGGGGRAVGCGVAGRGPGRGGGRKWLRKREELRHIWGGRRGVAGEGGGGQEEVVTIDGEGRAMWRGMAGAGGRSGREGPGRGQGQGGGPEGRRGHGGSYLINVGRGRSEGGAW